MRALELKDICGYLPYEINYLHPDGVTILQASGILGILMQVKEKGEITYSSLCGCKPILRPMSYLTKEIHHKGETFVPIVELAKIAFPIWEWDVDYNGCCESNRGCIFSYGEDGGFHVDGTITNAVPKQLEMFDKLSEWMFDYRGLIDGGMALDVNTLSENIYEK